MKNFTSTAYLRRMPRRYVKLQTYWKSCGRNHEAPKPQGTGKPNGEVFNAQKTLDVDGRVRMIERAAAKDRRMVARLLGE